MHCIAETAEREDVRCEFRIEVRWCFLAMYQPHLRAWAEIFNAQNPTLRRRIVWMWVDCLAEFRSTVPEIYVFGHTFGILLRPEMAELPGVAT